MRRRGLSLALGLLLGAGAGVTAGAQSLPASAGLTQNIASLAALPADHCERPRLHAGTARQALEIGDLRPLPAQRRGQPFQCLENLALHDVAAPSH